MYKKGIKYITKIFCLGEKRKEKIDETEASQLIQGKKTERVKVIEKEIVIEIVIKIEIETVIVIDDMVIAIVDKLIVNVDVNQTGNESLRGGQPVRGGGKLIGSGNLRGDQIVFVGARLTGKGIHRDQRGIKMIWTLH